MRTIGAGERRARLVRRHRLDASDGAADAVEVARDLVALHSTDPASVFLAAMVRGEGIDVASVERALYEERALVRLLGMRRTMWVVSREVAPVVQAAVARAVEAKERERLLQILSDSDVAEPLAWLAAAEEATMKALEARGEAVPAELADDVPALRQRLVVGKGTRFEAVANASTRVLFLMAAGGRVVRTRPRGSWLSTQYRWAPTSAWLPGGTGLDKLPTGVARVALAWRWLAAYGPATVADLAWWTGLTMGEVRRAVAELPTAAVDLDGASGLVLADDLDPVAAPEEPSAVLLSALDPTVMGWKERSWYLGGHGPALFDANGNAGPTVWWDGRVVGGWAQSKTGEVRVRLLEDAGSEAEAAVERAAVRLQGILGDVVLAPRARGRSLVERELTGPADGMGDPPPRS